jgi:condensin complex subunit 2
VLNIKARTTGNTLEKDINNLNLKRLDVEYNVDPLFRKTSSDFDEGGAKGLLLNHLNIGYDGGVIFDSSDLGSDVARSNETEKKPPTMIDCSTINGK